MWHHWRVVGFRRWWSIILCLPLGPVAERVAAAAADAPPRLSAEQQELLRQCDDRSKAMVALLAAGNFTRVIADLEKNFAARREVLGESDQQTFLSMQALAQMNAVEGNQAEARRWAEMALAAQLKARDANHWLVRTARRTRDDVQRWASLSTERRLRLREADQLCSQGEELSDKGDYSAALKPFARAIEIRKQELGPEHPETLDALNMLGYLYREQKDFEHGEPALTRCLEARRRVLGDDDPVFAVTCNNLAWLYYYKQDYKRVEALMRQAAETFRRGEGQWSFNYATTLNNLAELYMTTREYRRAEALRQQVLEIRKHQQGENHTEYAKALRSLAYVYENLQEYDKAEPLARQALAIFRKNLGPKDKETIQCLRTVAYIVREGGHPRESLPLELEALHLFMQTDEPDEHAIGINLYQISSVYIALKNYVKALEFQRRATQVFHAIGGDKAEDYRIGLSNEQWLLGFVGYEQEEREDFAAARQSYEQQFAILEKLEGPDNYETINSRLSLAFVDQLSKLPASKRAELKHAEELFDKAYELGLKKPREALPPADDALTIRRRILGDEHFKTIASIFQVSYLYKELGDYAKAKAMRNDLPELCLRLKGQRHPDYASSLHNLANLHESMGEYAKALEIYKRASVAWKECYGPKHKSLANTLNSIAACYDSLGDSQRAEKFYREALDMRRELLGARNIDYAHSLLNMGAFYMWSLNDDAKAEPLIEQAVAIYKTAVGEKHPAYARGIDFLASLDERLKRYERAESLYQQALAIRKEMLGEKHQETGITMHNLALLYSEQRKYDKAEPLYLNALAIDEAVVGKVHPKRALTLRLLSEVYVGSGRLSDAERVLKESAETCKQVLGVDSDDYADSISRLGVVYALGSEPGRGVQPALEALEKSKARLELDSGFLSERRQLAMRSKLWHYMDNYLFVTARAVTPAEEVYSHVLNWKGIVGAGQQQLRSLIHRLAASGNSEVAALATELEQATQSLAHQSRAANASDRERQFRLEELSDKIERLQQQLAGMSAEFNRQRQQSRRTADDIRRVLPADAVLVDCLAYERPVLVSDRGTTTGNSSSLTSNMVGFVIRPKRPVVRVEFGPTQPVADAITAWRKRYGTATAAGNPGEQLRGMLWKPLESHLAGANVLLISPNSTLAPLPWAALPGRSRGHYLIDDIGVAVVPVPRLLPELLAQQPGAGSTDRQASLLVVGDVDFGAMPGRLGLAFNSHGAVRGAGSLHWSSLPGTRDEIVAVEKSFNARFARADVIELARAAATKAAVRGEAGRHEYLHFSTHGFFAPPDVQSAVGGNSAETGPGKEQQSVSGYHPGLLSGLVLAGANRTSEDGLDDGILTALEVEELDLSRVQLATLSACETGLGQTAGGEGLLGLQRAFQTAGARSVLAGLWKVPDRATQALMSRFYANLWQKKMTRLDALREAQQWMIHEGPKLPGGLRGLDASADDMPIAATGQLPPYYWAAFVLSGDWR